MKPSAAVVVTIDPKELKLDHEILITPLSPGPEFSNYTYRKYDLSPKGHVTQHCTGLWSCDQKLIYYWSMGSRGLQSDCVQFGRELSFLL